MLYVVSGFMRTGTSAMMKALEAGGMEAVKAESREQMRRRRSDKHYDPNKGGLYELDPKAYQQADFPRGFDGKLIKVLNYGVPRFSVMKGGIMVVFMRRDPEEIRQSYMAFFNENLDVSRYTVNMTDIVERINNRKDVVSCIEVGYRDLVADPLSVFEVLADLGWPIDTKKSAGVIDLTLCRYKREELDEGVV